MRKITRRDFMKTMSVAAAAMSLTACGGNTAPGSTAVSAASASAGATSGESKVVVGLAGDPQNIGPFQGMSLGRIGCLYTMYEFLVTTEGGEMQGVMMKDGAAVSASRHGGVCGIQYTSHDYAAFYQPYRLGWAEPADAVF